jgi:chemotaxis protein CheX
VKIEYINPFIESVYEAFSSMLGSKATRGTVASTSDAFKNPLDLLTIIGISGPAKGTVALSFPAETAMGIVTAMVGEKMETMDDTVADGVAELVNIVAGSAKAKLATLMGEGPMSLSLPTVIRGKNYSVSQPSDTKWLEVPFESDCGPFVMRVSFEFQKKE